MPFQARKGVVSKMWNVKVDHELQRMIEEIVITIPIVWIKGSLFLVGVNKIHIEMKAEDVIAQVGGGYEKFEEYIKKNHKILERALMTKMIQSKESLEWIVDALIKGQKIPNKGAIGYDSSTLELKKKKSSNRISTGGRIIIERRPSTRVNKYGIMLTHYNPSMMSATGGLSPKSRSRGGLSPMRSPTPKSKSRISTASPMRSAKGLSSPTSKGKTEQREIEEVQAIYGKQKMQVVQDIEENKAERFEHIGAKDQTVVKFNRGKYSYIHGK